MAGAGWRMPAYAVRNSLLWHSTTASYASLTEANVYRSFMVSAYLSALSASREVSTSAAGRVLWVKAPQETRAPSHRAPNQRAPAGHMAWR